MKNILLLFIAVAALASCSAPKYAYYFDNHDYQAGKRKKQASENVATRVTVEEIMQAVQAPQVEEPIAVASAGKEIYPSSAKVNTPESATPLVLNHKDKHDLKRQMKSAIKDYKKQSHEDSTAEGGKNQLVTLLLAIFLGGLGIHRFYIGRTATAFYQLGLFILGLFLVIPLYILFAWVLIDIIRIAMGKLVPASGSYNPEL